MLRSDISQCQVNAGSCIPVGGLYYQLPALPRRKLRLGLPLMGASDDRHFVFGRSDPIGPVQGMLKHRSGSDKRAILFWLMTTQPPLNKGFEPFAFSAR